MLWRAGRGRSVGGAALGLGRGVWRGTWLEALMLLLALVFGTRHAAQEFIYFAF